MRLHIACQRMIHVAPYTILSKIKLTTYKEIKLITFGHCFEDLCYYYFIISIHISPLFQATNEINMLKKIFGYGLIEELILLIDNFSTVLLERLHLKNGQHQST